jgi:hypothetical protein
MFDTMFVLCFVQSQFIANPNYLYESELDPTLQREEHGLKKSVNRVPRRMFGDKREEIIGKWKKLHNQELHNLYNHHAVIKVIKRRMLKRTEYVTLIGDICAKC